MSSGWLMKLVAAGYTVSHEHSTRSNISDSRGTVRTVITGGNLTKPLKIEQDCGTGRGATSLYEVYRYACIQLGLAKEYQHCDEGPVDVSVHVKDKGTVHEQTVFEHPSFGVAKLVQYTGGSKHFMSPINTLGGIKMTIETAELHHSPSGHDRVYGRKQLIEIEMSLTQWAEFIMSTGKGSGVPCTLSYFNGIDIDNCVLPTAEERIEVSARKGMKQAVAELEALWKELEPELAGPGSISAGRKKEIHDKLRRGLRGLTETPPYLMRVFREYMDTAMTHAKSEFAHYAREFGKGDAWKAITGTSAEVLGAGEKEISEES